MKINPTNTAVVSAVGSAKAGSGDKFAAALNDAASNSGPEGQLEDYMKMTPAQRIRMDLLKKLGLTEEKINAMSPEQRTSVEAKMADLVKEEMKKPHAGQAAVTVDTFA